MTLQFCLLSLTLFFGFTYSATAGLLWQTTKATIKDGNIQYATFHYFSQGVLVSADFNDPTPNPCVNYSCVLNIGVFTNSSSQPYYPSTTTGLGQMTSSLYPGIINSKTMGELYHYIFFQNTAYKIGMVVGGNSSYAYCDPTMKNDCIYKNQMEAYSHACYFLLYSQNTHNSYQPMPNQSCIGPTPPNNECTVDTGSVTLDHGELLADAVNENKKRQKVNISCTYPANAKIAFYSKDANDNIALKSDGSLYSTVTIDGISGSVGKIISIPKGGTTVDLESTLHTVGDVVEGVFSGTGILVINNY